VLSFSDLQSSKAPELCEASIRGTDMFCKGILTTKADVYSLGCIIIELFAGNIKFDFSYKTIDDVCSIINVLQYF